MKTYTVSVMQVHSITLTVHAMSERDAVDIAQTIADQGLDEADAVYEFTLGCDDWPVEEIC